MVVIFWSLLAGHNYAGTIGDAFILMPDHARAHTVHVYKTFLDDKCNSVMNWLARSLVLNPIEHTVPGTFFLDAFDSGRIIQRMYRPLSKPWFRNCRLYRKMASGLCHIDVRSVWTIGEAIQVIGQRMC